MTLIVGLLTFLTDSSHNSRASVSSEKKYLHGEKQVEKMLLDRPNMAVYTTRNGEKVRLTPDDSIWKWAAQAYSAVINQSHINWDKSDLVDKPSEYLADHDIPQPQKNGAIRVRLYKKDLRGNSYPLSFEELWNACIFELINIKKAENFMFAYRQALQGKMDRESYIRYNQELEYQSLVELKNFFVNVWKPWAVSKSVALSTSLWEQDLPKTFNEWISQYKNGGYLYWENYYDQELAPESQK